MERGLALGKSNVKDVILGAKHESGANIKEVNMFGGGGVGGWGLASFDSRSFRITRCTCVGVLNASEKPLGFLFVSFPLLESHRAALCLPPMIVVLQDKPAAPARIRLLSARRLRLKRRLQSWLWPA